MGEPMYLFLQTYSHDFDADRQDLKAIKADVVEAEHEYKSIMDRVQRWNDVHNRSAAPAPARPVPASYNSLPAGYTGAVGGAAQPPAYPTPAASAAYPTPSSYSGGAPSAHNQPPPPYGGYGAATGAGGGAAPPPYAAAMSSPASATGGGGGAAAAARGPWTCKNCTYRVPPDQSPTACPICASPRS